MGEPRPNQTPNQTFPPRCFSSSTFGSGQFRFEVVQWPTFSTMMVNDRNNLIPLGDFKAKYKAKWLSVVVWTSAATFDQGTKKGGVLFNIQLSGEPESKQSGVSSSKLVNKFFRDQEAASGKTNLSGLQYMCLTDNNTQNNKSIQEGFETLKQGRVVRTTKQSADSNAAVINWLKVWTLKLQNWSIKDRRTRLDLEINKMQIWWVSGKRLWI